MKYFKQSSSNLITFVLFLSFFLIQVKVEANPKVFNLKDYGAIEGGNNDISQALEKAWNDACKSSEEAQIEIPEGMYLLKPIKLVGPCKSPVKFVNKGTLKAPLGMRGDYWITFLYINGLKIYGGRFDGSGPPKQAAPGLPTMIKLNFVSNSVIKYVKLRNSQSTHLSLFACNNTEITKVSISSPKDSPNTDGIKLAVARNIIISDTMIASGDDCVAMLTGCNNVTVTRVKCGPGHGISIGSMGGSPNEIVQHINVSKCNFTDTMNGLRIKTKATNNPGLVSDIAFEDIVISGSGNPILIEQNYCPSKNCGQGNSKVQIKNVKFSNVRGTSKFPAAVRIECSQTNPCQNIELNNINLKLESKTGPTISNCLNVKGRANGIQVPESCI